MAAERSRAARMDAGVLDALSTALAAGAAKGGIEGVRDTLTSPEVRTGASGKRGRNRGPQTNL